MASAALVGCTGSPNAAWLLVPKSGDSTTDWLIVEASRYLEAITGEAPQIRAIDEAGLAEFCCGRNEDSPSVALVLDAQMIAPDRFEPDVFERLGESGFILDVDDRRQTTVVLAAGQTKLARRYALYEFLRRMGVRFFHPEDEFVPRQLQADLRELAARPTILHVGREYVPDYASRSWGFHGAHPLEHLEAFSDGDHPIDEARHLADWTIKNRGNRFRGGGRGIASAESKKRRERELDELQDSLGFPRGTGIKLHNQQQGADADVAFGPGARERIERVVEERLRAMPDARWFGIDFGPTEFTVTPDEETVQWIDWAGQKALALDPNLRVEVNAHITGSQPTPHHGDLGCASGTNEQSLSDYYDLAFHTDPRFAVKVHTAMFYPLEGDARVYNQRSFAHKLCLMDQASRSGRSLTWFPEGSWWLSFDNAVPVYLPLYLWSRLRDNELLKPLLAARGSGHLDGFRMFTSGQEWGYWQQDYAVGLWAWNADVTLQDVLGEMFDPFCDPAVWRTGCSARQDAIAILEEVIEHQREFFLERPDWQGHPGGLFAYFAGEDESDGLAIAGGMEFRPIRVPFATVLSWDAADRSHFEDTDLQALDDAAQAYGDWRRRLESWRGSIPEDGRRWFDEVVDGLEIDQLRAEHISHLYRAVLAHARASDGQDDAKADEPGREAHQPEGREDEIEHARAALETAAEVVRRREAGYRYPAAQTHGGGLTPETAKPNGTQYPYRVHTKTHLLTYWTNRQVEAEALLARSEGEEPAGSNGGTTPKGGVTLLSPSHDLARAILPKVFPAFVWVYEADRSGVSFGPDTNGDREIDPETLVFAPIARRSGPGFAAQPIDVSVPIVTNSPRKLQIGLVDAVISGGITDRGLKGPVAVHGRLLVADLVSAMHVLAGFDESGAIYTLSTLLDFDPKAPPTTVDFAAEFVLQAQ